MTRHRLMSRRARQAPRERAARPVDGAEWWSVLDLIPILNRLTKTTNALGGTVQFSYDAMNRMATRTDALTHGESYGYEPGGGLNKLTDRKGQVTGDDLRQPGQGPHRRHGPTPP